MVRVVGGHSDLYGAGPLVHQLVDADLQQPEEETKIRIGAIIPPAEESVM